MRLYTVIGVLDSFWKLEFQFGQWREFKMEGTTNKLDATLQLSIVF
ncbi:MAG: hypothetical protein K9N11_01895 [Lentisphaeria bacterium]|nr:hypothetical protein [Lentisphaeria bacterium]